MDSWIIIVTVITLYIVVGATWGVITVTAKSNKNEDATVVVTAAVIAFFFWPLVFALELGALPITMLLKKIRKRRSL